MSVAKLIINIAALPFVTIGLIIGLSSLSFALPPQVAALNDFIEADSLCRTMPYFSSAYLDDDGIIHFCYLGTDGSQGRSVKYVAFGPEGDIFVGPTDILPSGFAHHYVNFRMLKDKDGNLHIVCDTQSIQSGDPVYVMLDNEGSVVKNIPIMLAVRASDLRILPDERLVINTYGRGISTEGLSRDWAYIGLDPVQNIFHLLAKDSYDFDTVMVESRETKKRIPSYNEQIFPLTDGRVLLLNDLIDYSYPAPDSMPVYVRKSVVDLAAKADEGFTHFFAQDQAAFIYSGIRGGMVIGNPRIFELGDTLLYWMPGPVQGVGSDSINTINRCAILLDRDGNLIKADKQEKRDILYRELDTALPGDRLCRDNAYQATRNLRGTQLSLFGIVSFREFPDVIIDLENK